MCHSAELCNIQPFAIHRPAARGWLPGLTMSAQQYDRLAAGCGAAEQCELTFEGTLTDLNVSPEKPSSMRFTDVIVVAAKPA